MLKIRLKRTGKKGEAHYKIIVAESTSPRDGRSIAEVGYYNPRTKPSTIDMDLEAVKDWMSKGAQPTETVEQMLVKLGVIKQIKRGSKLPQPKKKKGEEAEQA